MANLSTREDFFQDLFDFRRGFDQMFNRMLSGWPQLGESRAAGSTGRQGAFLPAVESYIDKNTKTFHCRVSLPGIDPKDVQINANRDSLTIRGERKVTRASNEGVDFGYNEIWYGAFERTLPFPEGVDLDKLNAESRNGVLEITAPIAAAALPRKIEIKAAPAAKQASA
jgi:HSP20 family protein